MEQLPASTQVYHSISSPPHLSDIRVSFSQTENKRPPQNMRAPLTGGDFS